MKTLRAAALSAALVLLAACGDKDAGVAPAGEAPSPTVAAETATAPAGTLTEAQALAVVKAAEAASMAFDADAAAATLADDAQFEMTLPAEMQIPVQKAGKAEAIASIREQAATASERTYTSEIGEVRMHGDGQAADIDVSVVSKYVMQGRRIEETADQVYTVELRDGAPMVVAVRSTTTGVIIDGVKRF